MGSKLPDEDGNIPKETLTIEGVTQGDMYCDGVFSPSLLRKIYECLIEDLLKGVEISARKYNKDCGLK